MSLIDPYCIVLGMWITVLALVQMRCLSCSGVKS